MLHRSIAEVVLVIVKRASIHHISTCRTYLVMPLAKGIVCHTLPSLAYISDCELRIALL